MIWLLAIGGGVALACCVMAGRAAEHEACDPEPCPADGEPPATEEEAQRAVARNQAAAWALEGDDVGPDGLVILAGKRCETTPGLRQLHTFAYAYAGDSAKN